MGFVLGFIAGAVFTVAAFVVWGASAAGALRRVTEDITRP
jgi:hypothetical protein